MSGPPTGASSARHHFEEHTGEVLLSLEAPSAEALFEQAGRALAELLASEPPPAVGEELRVEVSAPDLPALLAEWLNELIFQSEIHKQVFTAFRFERLSENALAGFIRGGEPRELRTAVKAATFHRLAVERHAGGFRATVVLDV